MEGAAAQGTGLAPLAWATLHFGQAPLGDVRRGKRLVRLAAALAENPAMSLPKLLPDWSDLTAAYRFLSNPAVDPQAVYRPHQDLVRQGAADQPVVLCLQDDTSLDFSRRTGIRGLGIIGDGGGRGLLQHGALAVTPDGRVLGVLHLAWHAIPRVPAGETRRQSQARWCKHDVWADAAVAIGPWAGSGRLIHVGDSHADLFRFFQQTHALGHEVVVRAMHDRYVDDQTRRLWDKLAAAEVLGRLTVRLAAKRDQGNRITRPAREAHLTLRAAAVEIAPPPHDPRTAGAAPLTMYAVYAQEEAPPAGAEAVEWMLLTSLSVDTWAQAETVLGYYRCRWIIEEWHRCQKQGCRIEQSQLDEAADLMRLAALVAVLAVRLLQWRDLADSPQADTPAALRAAVPELYVQLAAALARVPAPTLTPRQFWQTVARRGGWLGRKHDGRPGWLVLWRGWSDLLQMVRGAELYQQISSSARKCV